MKKRIKLQGSLMFAALLGSLFFFKYLFPASRNRSISLPLDALGIILVMSGFTLRISARGFKSDNSLNSHSLVSGGAYALTRNPMYMGTFLIGTGFCLSAFNWWVSLIFCCVYLLIYVPQIRKEENILLQNFGDEYRNYCSSTPRFFPEPAGLFKKGQARRIFFKKKWVRPELPSLFWVTVILTLLGAWEDFRLGPHAGYSKALLQPLLVFFAAALATALFYEKENIPGKKPDIGQ